MRDLRQSTRASYRRQTPNTVMPVSLTSMAHVPSSKLMSKAAGDSVPGRESSEEAAPTLLRKKIVHLDQ